MGWRRVAVVPFLIGGVVYGWVGVLAWQDAAGYASVGESMSDGLNDMEYGFGVVLWLVAAAMVLLGLRHVVDRRPSWWADKASGAGAVAWLLALAPFLTLTGPNSGFGPGNSQLWFAGGIWLVSCSLYVLVALVAPDDARRPWPARTWFIWLPAMALFGAAALV